MNDWLYTMLEDDTCQGRKCRKKEQAWGRINGVGGGAAWLRRWPVKKDLRQKKEALGYVGKNLQEDKITRTKARERVGCWLLFSRSVVPASLWPHGLQQARIPCPPSLPTTSCSLLKLISTESMVPSSHLILCRPFLLLPSVFPSIRVFSSESALRIRRPKDWHFSFSISPSTESSGLASFRVDCFDLLAVQRDSQESSPAPWFEGINSSTLSLFWGPTLTSKHDHWKNHNLNYTDLHWQSDVSAF